MRLYLDNNSTTPLLPEVAEAMARAPMGNPASAHRTGAAARLALETARSTIADCLQAHPDEVLFTSGATEANNLALFSMAEIVREAYFDREGPLLAGRPTLLLSPIEHPSILEPARLLATRDITLIEPQINQLGYVLPNTIPQNTSCITLQLANHETGVVQNIADLRHRFHSTPFHTDATQAVGKIPVRFHDLGVNTIALSAHKFHGPLGIGVLLFNRCYRVIPRTFGGHQQMGRRPGTEPVALAVGMATALKLACDEMNRRHKRCHRLRFLFIDTLRRIVPDFIINGDPDTGLPHTLNLSFPGCSSETLFIRLDLAGVDCSTGSACSTGSMLPSPTLQAMGLPNDRVKSAMRFSLSHLLTDEEIMEAATRVGHAVRASQ